MDDKGKVTLLFLPAVLLLASATEAAPMINELFIQPSENHMFGTEEYIEIIVPAAKTAHYLDQFALAIIDASSIVAYVDFKDMTRNDDDAVDDSRLIVVSNNIQTPNLKYYSPSITFRPSAQLCVLLIHRPQLADLNLLELRTVNSVYRLTRPVPLTNQNKNVLKRLAVDILVYQKASVSHELDAASWLRQIIPQWTGVPHQLPIGGDVMLDSVSLSRCDNNQMSGTSFRHEVPTPAIQNRCENERVDAQEYMIAEEYANLREERRQNGVNPHPNREYVRPENTVEAYIGRLDELNLASKPFKDFFNTHSERKYYRFLPNQDDLAKSSIRCEVCYQTRQDSSSNIPFSFRPGTIPNQIKETGHPLSGINPSETWKRIKQHQTLHYHQEVVAYIKSGSPRRPSNDVYEEIEPRAALQVTADKIALVYLETKVGMSLRSHEVMAEGLRDIGFTIGESLDRRHAAKDIVKFLGEKIHDNMIKRLIASDSVFSIMLDSSTDVGSVHTMLIYIRYIEDGAPVTKVLQLTESHDSSAQGMWNEIEKSIQSQGPLFEAYVKKNCVAMATDGASNMMGQHNSLKTKFTNYLMTGSRAGRPFQHYHCSNHKLALAYNDVVYSRDPALSFCRKLTTHCNDLARFYASKSYKRRDEMLIQSEITNEPVRAFHRIQQVRWVPATQRSYAAVVHNYRTFMNHLSSMIDPDPARLATYPPEALVNAMDLHDIFSYKNLLATMHLHMDIIFELTKWAKWLERREATIIDLEEWHLDVISAFGNMKQHDGHNLQTFLKSCICSGIPCNSLETFESSSDVVWKGVALANHEDKTQIPKLSTTRNLVLDSLLTKFETRFPAAAISAFSVLLPKRLSNTNNAHWQKLGDYMVTFHGFENSISVELVAMKDSVLRSQYYLANRNQPPEVFWSNLLSSSEIKLTPTLQKVINIALVQPSSTALVEAGFSIVTAIKTKYRSALSTPFRIPLG